MTVIDEPTGEAQTRKLGGLHQRTVFGNFRWPDLRAGRIRGKPRASNEHKNWKDEDSFHVFWDFPFGLLFTVIVGCLSAFSVRFIVFHSLIYHFFSSHALSPPLLERFVGISAFTRTIAACPEDTSSVVFVFFMQFISSFPLS
jgi:hypothetical protein